jgi:hypothetical protein
LQRGQTQLASKRARDFLRLVIAAFATALAMQRHRHEYVDVVLQLAQRRKQQQRQGAAQRARTAVLQRLHVIVERRGVLERRHDGVHLPRAELPRAVVDRPGEPATGTGIAHPHERCGTDGAEPAARRPAARRATFDEQPVDEAVNHCRLRAVDSARHGL